MLEVTNISQEEILGVNFADIYKNSDLYQYVFPYIWICLNLALFIYVDLTYLWGIILQEKQSSN